MKILIGKKSKDKYNGWCLPPNTWTTIQQMWIEDGQIKIWNKEPYRFKYIIHGK